MGDFHLLFFASFPGALRSGSKASVCRSASHFRSTPINGHHQTGPIGPVRANIGSTGRDAAA